MKGIDNMGKPKGVNPFGEARPREQVLAEKGQDWKKIDEQLESVKIKEASGGDGFGKRGFGSSNGGGGRATLPESRTERSWRKPQFDDDRPKRFVIDTNTNPTWLLLHHYLFLCLRMCYASFIIMRNLRLIDSVSPLS